MYTRVHNILYDEHFLLRAILDVYWCASKTQHVQVCSTQASRSCAMTADFVFMNRSQVDNGMSLPIILHKVPQLATLGTGNKPVSVLPVLASCYVTVGLKNLRLLLYPFIIALGCVSDDIRSEPGSWYLLTMLPYYLDGPAEHCARWKQLSLHGPVQKLQLCGA